MEAMLYHYTDEEKDLKTSKIKNCIICALFSIVMIPPTIGGVVIGILYFDECKVAGGKISVYLIVLSLNCFLFLLKFLLRHVMKLSIYYPLLETIQVFRIMYMFHLVWIAVGCYWVYGNFEPEYKDKESPIYCNSVLYGSSFFVTALLIAFMVFHLFEQFCFGRTLNYKGTEDFPITAI